MSEQIKYIKLTESIEGLTTTQSRPGRQESTWRGLWWRRTRLEKATIGLCGVVLVACVALVSVLAISSVEVCNTTECKLAADELSQAITISVLPVDVCDTPECKLAADELNQAMDTSVDPCHNFYKFACGGWINNNPVPEDSPHWSQLDIQRRKLSKELITILSKPITEEDTRPIAKAKTFYQGCMERAQLEEMSLTPLTNFLDQFGGWPMTINDWKVTPLDWQTVMAESKRQVGADYLMSVWKLAGRNETTEIYIDQTSLGLDRFQLVKPWINEEHIAAYKFYITTTAALIAESLGQTVNVTQMDTDVEDLLIFEKKLAKITSPAEARRDISRMYNPMTVEELSSYSDLDWLPILSIMFTSANITMNNKTRIVVQELEYIINLVQLMLSTNKRTSSNYMMWRHVQSLGDATTQAMRDASLQYSKVANGVTAKKPRSNHCVDEVNNSYLGTAIGIEYVKTYFTQQAKDEASEMVEDLRSAFKSLVEAKEWMDDETKLMTIEKADAITKFIGYPDWYSNKTALKLYYESFHVDLDNRAHFANVLTLKGFGHPIVHDGWAMPPTAVNAFYEFEDNRITVPAGILAPPFYRPNTIMALNYGGIGQIMGHEITHGFDDRGVQYTKDGSRLPWWSKEMLQIFRNQSRCMVDQYGSIRLPELDEYLPNATINGINTLGENIADNGGLRQALLAYKTYVEQHGEEPRLPGLTEYSPMQLFFLSTANMYCESLTTKEQSIQVLLDSHSPEPYRTLIQMANMKEFSDIWGCPAGSTMNPEHKCVVW